MPEINQDLADSIAMLEQILEVMPQDIDAIKALYSANLQSRNVQRAFEYLNRLTDVAAGTGDPELFEYLQNELPRFNDFYPSEVVALQSRIKTLFGVHRINQGISRVSEEPVPHHENFQTETDIGEELALAWRLYEENQLSQDEYSSVLHDLTETSSKDLDVPVSVLHVLHDRGFANLTRIMVHMSNRSGVPFLSIGNFEIDENAATVLGLDYAAHEGALPFGFVGNDLLVAVLNPFNNILLEQIEGESGHRCHTFVVEPADYDAALLQLRSLLEAAA